MTTVADLVEATFDHLYGNHRQSLNVLATSLDTSTTSVVLTYSPDEVARGSFVAIDDELLYVVAVDRSTKTLTVIRAQRGTTAAAHTSGALVDINPRFPRYRVKEALRQEVRSWPEDLFRVQELDLDTTSGTAGYDLTGIASDFYAVLDVQLGPQSASTRLDWTRVGYHVIRNADTSAFASGAGLVLTGVLPTDARDVRVVVARPFATDTWNDDTTLEATVGLASSMLDIPPLGAAWRLMVGRDVKRSMGEGQGEPRRAEEIPPGFASSTATYLQRQRDRRLSEEAARLRGAYPIRT